MSNDDLQYKDSASTPVPFTPHAKDKGTSTSTNLPTRQPQIGIDDGEFATFGGMGDVPANGDTWTSTGISFLRAFKGAWRDLYSQLVALNISAASTAPVTTTVTGSLPAGSNALGTVGLTGALPSLAAGENHAGEVGGNSVVAVGTITRQANTTAYASGQAIQPATAVALALTVARKNAGTGRIPRARLTKSGTSLTNASFRVHLFKTAPTTLPADGTAFTPNNATDYIGAFPITISRAFADGSKGIGVPEVGPYITFDTAAGSMVLYAFLEATAAYTPASGEIFTIALEADRD